MFGHFSKGRREKRESGEGDTEEGKKKLEKVCLRSLLLWQDPEHSNLISKTECRTGKGALLIIKALLVTSCEPANAYCRGVFPLFPFA